MPMINGLKMACEPCIRGHRSTKCNHAKERLMVPVRKPGRPLSVCPHKADQSCGCAGVTAAIPRSQKCGCGSTNSHPDSPVIKSENSNPKSPGSPTRRTFHVQKSSSQRQPNRVDAAALERTDISHLNIHAPPSWTGGPVTMPTNGYVVPVHPPSSAFSIANALPNGYQQTSGVGYEATYVMAREAPIQVPLPNGGLAVGFDSHHFSVTNGSNVANPAQSISSSSVTSSCCAPTSSSSPRHTPTSSTSSVHIPSPANGTSGGSCCGGGKQTNTPANVSAINQYSTPGTLQPLVNGKSAGVQIPPPGAANGPFVPPYGPPLGVQQVQQVVPHYFNAPGSVLYTYPAPYGTYLSPLQPAQWRQTVSSTHGHTGTPEAMPMAPVAAQAYSTNGSSATPGVSHICSCGDLCNCLGCPAHPYNEATQEYVRSAMNSMLEPQRVEAATNGTSEDSVVVGNAGVNGHGPTPTSPSQAQTPSDASGISEDQTQLSANDFFFVTYPLGNCGGESTSCPCGEDCECVGCLIHNTGSDAFDG